MGSNSVNRRLANMGANYRTWFYFLVMILSVGLAVVTSHYPESITFILSLFEII